MANKAISELPQALNVNNQDLFVLEQGGLAKKLTAETFITEQGIIDALAEALDGHGGIQSVTLQSLSGRVRTYLITFSDGSATTFQVLDGSTITNIQKTSTAGLVDTYTVYMSDGTTTFFQVRNGQDGSATWDQINSKAPVITDTATGAIANFPDGADDMPVTSLVADIEPVQNLHGYSNPWPAGGGKNLLPPRENNYSANGITATWNADGSVTFSGTATANAIMTIPFTLPANTTVTFSAHNTSAIGSGVRFMLIGEDQQQVYLNNANVAVTWTPTADVTSARFMVSSGYPASGTVWPQIELGSTASSFAPYSNICPITGHTQATVTRAGKNLLNTAIVYSGLPALTVGASENSITSSSRYGYSGRIPAELPMILSAKSNNTTNFDWVRVIRYVDGIVVQNLGGFEDISTTKTLAIPALDNSYIKVVYGAKANGTIGVTVPGDVQVELGSTATTYEPYQGTTLTVDWTTEAGTVYGGSLDVTTGVLTVTDANIASYNGETLPSTWISDRDVYASGTTPTTGAEVVYKLDTQQAYQLTPQQLNTFLGTNNIFSDCSSVEVEYRADTKLYIEKLTMPTEDDLVANQAITSGQYFMIGNSLYLALANIANGAQITIGTNAQRVSLADALNAINT